MGKMTESRYGEKVERIEPTIPARRVCSLCGCMIDEEPSDAPGENSLGAHRSCREDFAARLDAFFDGEEMPPRDLGRFNCAGRYIFPTSGKLKP